MSSETGRDTIWAAVISLAVNLFVLMFSFGIAHSELKPLLFVVLAPGMAVHEVAATFGANRLSGTQVIALALAAQFATVFAIAFVALRAFRRGKRG